MNKQQFLNELSRGLGDLPREEKADILFDYESHFEMAMAEGKTEERIVSALGSPRAIAKEIRAVYRVNQVRHDASAGNVVRAMVATISLGFFNLIFVLGPFLGLCGALLGLWGGVMGLVFSPLVGLFQVVTDGQDVSVTLFPAMASLGLGLMLIVLMFFVTKWFFRMFIKYLQFNVRMIQGRG